MQSIEIIKPSILISEIFFPWVDQEEKIYEAIEKVAGFDYYESMEIAPVKSGRTRKQIAKIKNDRQLTITQWFTKELLELGLNPSTLDKGLRAKTVKRLKELVDMAAECEIQNVAIISGEDSGEAKREEARKGLEEVMFALCEKVKEYKDMKVLLEALDRGRHKNNLIGPITEAVGLVDKIRETYDNIFLSWDSAHVALNEEDLSETIRFAADRILQIHFSNAVLDKTSSLYGDYHMEIGTSGFLDEIIGYEIITEFYKVIRSNPMRHYASVEVRTPMGQNPWEYEKKCRKFLKSILEKEID